MNLTKKIVHLYQNKPEAKKKDEGSPLILSEPTSPNSLTLPSPPKFHLPSSSRVVKSHAEFNKIDNGKANVNESKSVSIYIIPPISDFEQMLKKSVQYYNGKQAKDIN